MHDHHSSFTFEDSTEDWRDSLHYCIDATPEMVPFDSTIGYVKIGTCQLTQNDWKAYEADIHNQIEQADNPGIKGWIVDLRGNQGGVMLPMLIGIEPVLGTGVTNFWKNPDGTYDSTTVYGPVSSEPYYQLIAPNPKVAVLTDDATASSGEGATIAFRGRPNTRSFGKVTCGLTTGRSLFPFSGVGKLNLAASYMADRNKQLYLTGVVPDVVETNSSLAMQKAIDWLKQ